MHRQIRRPKTYPDPHLGGVLARQLQASANEVGGPFGNGQDGGLRIAGYSRRHDRRIDDPQAGNADYAQPRIDDCARIPAEAARTDGMKRSVRMLADVRESAAGARQDLSTDAGRATCRRCSDRALRTSV